MPKRDYKSYNVLEEELAQEMVEDQREKEASLDKNGESSKTTQVEADSRQATYEQKLGYKEQQEVKDLVQENAQTTDQLIQESSKVENIVHPKREISLFKQTKEKAQGIEDIMSRKKEVPYLSGL